MRRQADIQSNSALSHQRYGRCDNRADIYRRNGAWLQAHRPGGGARRSGREGHMRERKPMKGLDGIQISDYPGLARRPLGPRAGRNQMTDLDWQNIANFHRAFKGRSDCQSDLHGLKFGIGVGPPPLFPITYQSCLYRIKHYIPKQLTKLLFISHHVIIALVLPEGA